MRRSIPVMTPFVALRGVLLACVMLVGVVLAGLLSGCDGAATGQSEQTGRGGDDVQASAKHRVALKAPDASTDIVFYELNADRGKALFVSKYCVLCHAVNGVGGKAGPALEAAPGTADSDQLQDPLAFAARMWRGAPAMSALQAAELGYQIDLTAAELAALSAFIDNPKSQAEFTDSDLPAGLPGWFIDAPISDEQGWIEYGTRGESLPTAEYFDKP